MACVTEDGSRHPRGSVPSDADRLVATAAGRALAPIALVLSLAGCAPVYETGVSVQPPLNSLTYQGLVGDGGAPVRQADYRINLGDTISIKFPRRPAYSDNFVVRPDGKISPPLLKSVLVAGRTSDDVQTTLVSMYGRLVRSAPPPAQRRYVLQPNDVLSVRFPYSADMNSEVVVRGDGRISLPIVGDVVAENKTPQELQTQLQQLYAPHVTNADLVVMVKESQSNLYQYRGLMRQVPDPGLTELTINVTKTAPLLVYVGGEVPAPGLQPYVAQTSALQAIYTAGGPAPTADMRSVVILRRGPDGSGIRLVTDLTTDLAGAGTGNTVLHPYDMVIVPRSTITLVGDALDQYLYRLVRPLANSSVGVFFTKQIGTLNQFTRTEGTVTTFTGQ